MRLIAALLTSLLVSACGGGSLPPASGTSTAPGAASSAPASPAPADAAMTFDCAKPANKVQRMVCGEPQLTELDRRVQTGYQHGLARPGTDQVTLAAAQGAFATIRDGCAHLVDARTCVVEAYQTRLVELAIADPATVTPPVITYDCPPDSGTLTAQFYNQLDPKAAVLDWKGNRVILFIEPSGSGAKYGRQGSQYWEHQGEVTLDLSGTKFVCHTQ